VTPDERAQIMQGDIVDGVVAAAPTTSGIVEEVALVMMISHSCEFTKTARNPDYPILVAPLLPLADLDASLRGKVRTDDVTRYWPLPANEWVEDESAVDLTLVQPVLGQQLLDGDRRCSMAPDGRIALADRLFSMLSLLRRPDDQ
jgi:hypothetical protein